MKGTQVLIGVAMTAIIGVTASFPGRVDASPQFEEKRSVLTAPQTKSSTPKTNYGKIKDSAESVKKAGDARADATNKVMEGERPNLDNLASKVYTAGEIVSAYSKDSKGAARSLSGVPVTVSGVVVNVVRGAGGSTTVFLAPPNGSKDAPLFAFRFGTEESFERGMQIELQGTFIDRINMQDVPNDVFLVQAAGTAGVTASTGVQAAAGPTEEVKPFDGWRFVGSVESEGSATGVFVREGKTLYAQPGDSLSPGLKVLDVRSGEAVLSESGRRASVMPW